ncbi:NAD-glutamate dehydrogenase [Micropruina sonneratiae]|uniref:NAD-glutamate dehydrogenase n=1 Tax=Micropruina sonneratiae TaxID=2986940 RepID=UPI002226F5E6|nr:NAD-glutamate dehydrogenase [Micropruina sp. KQZ13P-5]MCW3157446.1 NAD-glutamate dehydrogenase [Micropruina sp. KQZ13P-5]
MTADLGELVKDSQVGDVPTGFAEQYLRHLPDGELVVLDPQHVARLIEAHLAVGMVRRPGESEVGVRVADANHPGDSTLILIVTDDRPFLVDTVSMNITRRGWSIRGLFHPQVTVRRDGDGTVTALVEPGHGVEESWICVEVFPPLGTAADELAGDLQAGIVEGLAAVEAAVDDWRPMQRRLAETIDWLNDHPQPVSPHDVRSVTDLLDWLSSGNFVLLGYRESRVTPAGAFEPVPGEGLGILRDESGTDDFSAVPADGDRALLVLTKDSRRSPVHRPAYLDYIGIRLYDSRGELTGERRFLGLFSATAYGETVWKIPTLAQKAQWLIDRSGFDPQSHGGSAIRQAIDTYPRDELFQASAEELFPVISQEAQFKDRRIVRVFVRRGTYGRFISVLVYLPRDRYTTDVREAIQDMLLEELGGESLEHQARVSESVLARLFFVVKRPDGDPLLGDIDEASLQERIEAITRSWEDEFELAAQHLASEARGVEFSDAYKEEYAAAAAVEDLRLANGLDADDDLAYQVYAPVWENDEADVRFKVLGYRHMSLAEAMPHLSVLGVEVVDERPFELKLRGRVVYLYDFGLKLTGDMDAGEDWGPELQDRFIDAFDASYRGRAESGKFNRLVMTGGLTWREIAWLRAISRYLVQAGIPYSQPYVAAALNDNPEIAAALVSAFRTKFDPAAAFSDDEPRAAAVDAAFAGIEQQLADVASLDADRILRMFLSVLRAMVRTNAFQPDAPAHAFKLRPRELSLLPEPRPMFEVFVYSPRVQGVHLRFGTVARGGLRWSDRREDFRTEVLGLVKAQMVKNTVIVPTGAKGGFVPQQLPDPSVDRQAWLAEGVGSYQVFITSLLTLTDNIVAGEVVPPPDVVRWDPDDPYLVVAADKGTATFSDIANRISLERGFWLGDAFASGGSAGYDHKGMGITARGAWESVKRHFVELGRDCQGEDFTCVGIGDMAGDVFGNGMLLSRHTRLVAAFNHLHVFLDPDPDAATSYAERQRLFDLPRSSWADYDSSLISAGGGVYPRTLKSIPISAQVRAALGLPHEVAAMTPAELIHAILKAPVDLLWNGGIGTYVKASGETNAEVGDKANDAVRVNGEEVRARCAGEGGNLGWTQLGRVEYALAGGRINTDFIDNSAGVDTSDHEVNIKILLADRVAAGELSIEQRNELLASMTDEVAHLVLAHNFDQNIALANSASRSAELASGHEVWMRALEDAGYLDREIEFLPNSRAMKARQEAGQGLTRPELATLLAYTKIYLSEQVLATNLPDDPYLADRLIQYFPKELQRRYTEQIPKHRLAREIITTVAVNRFVNSQGITAFHRLSSETSAPVTEVIRAQLAARSIFAVGRSEVALARRTELDAAVGTELRMALRRMVERGTRWLLASRRSGIDIVAATGQFTDGVQQVREWLGDLLTPRQQARVEANRERLTGVGVPEELATEIAHDAYAHFALTIVDIADRLGVDLRRVAEVYFALAAQVGLDALEASIVGLPQEDKWGTLARAALREDVHSVHGELTAAVLSGGGDSEPAALVSDWLASVPGAREKVTTLRQVCDEPDVARMNVGVRTARSLLPA